MINQAWRGSGGCGCDLALRLDPHRVIIDLTYCVYRSSAWRNEAFCVAEDLIEFCGQKINEIRTG